MITTYEFHKDRAKLVDFSLKTKFWSFKLFYETPSSTFKYQETLESTLEGALLFLHVCLQEDVVDAKFFSHHVH